MSALTRPLPGLLLLVAGVGLGCARASEPALESPAQFCRRAVDLLSPPVSDSAYRTALPMLYSCPKQGGALLARIWENPPSNDTTLALLVGVGGHIHDGRIYAAAHGAAADTTRARTERLAGLFTLVSHYNPYLSAHDWGRPAYPGAPANQVGIGQSAHLVMGRGAVPLPRDAGVAIVGLYAELGRSDPDPQIRYVASELHRQIGRYVAGEQSP
jgi:hypothetical protein